MIPGQATRSAAQEWREGWPTVVISFVSYGVCSSFSALTTLFINPLEAEFRWSRTTITSGLLIVGVVCLLLSPAIGRLVDRWGTKRVALPGMMVYGAGLALLATSGSEAWNWWALWLIISIGVALTQSNVWITAVSKRFELARGKALAIMMCGNGAMVALYPILLNWVIDAHGWRAGYIAYGASAMFVIVPLLFLFFHDEVPAARTADAPVLPQAHRGLGVREAMVSTEFLRIALVAVMMTGSILAISVHLMPIMLTYGLTRAHAAAALPLVGIGAVIGRLGTGALLDHFSGRVVGAIGFLVPAVAVLTLLLAGLGGPLPFIVTFLFGCGLGVEIDVVAYTSTRYFGLKNHGVIFGTIAGAITFAAGVGPIASAAVFDLLGSYTNFLLATLVLFVLSSILVGSLGRYPDFAEPAPLASEDEPLPI